MFIENKKENTKERKFEIFNVLNWELAKIKISWK